VDPSGHRFVEDNDANPCRVIGGCETVVNGGWVEVPDAELIGITATTVVHSVSITSGAEILHNEHSGDETLFIYSGVSKGMGVGDGASASAYYGTANNVGDDNLNYSGLFAVWNVTATDILGGSASYSYYPLDNPFDPKRAHSKTMGPAIGEQLSANISLVEYMPIATRHADGSITLNIDDYLFNPKFGNDRRGPVGLTFRYTRVGWPLAKLWRELNVR